MALACSRIMVVFRYLRQTSLVTPWLVLVGCSGGVGNFAGGLVPQPNSTIELLESELRWYEDNLYRMDGQLARCFEQLESARRNNALLRTELKQALESASSAERRGQRRQMADPVYDEETEQHDPLLDLVPPTIELGEPSKERTPNARGGANDQRNGRNGAESPDIEINPDGLPDAPPGSAAPTGRPLFQSDSAANSPRGGDEVARITLNPRLTGGYDFDGQPGHDGVIVVIEPQNSDAEYVPQPGVVTVELVDPQKTGVAARVGKWKYDAVESAQRTKQTVLGQGIHLQLPWPDRPPSTDRLSLSVVFETANGRKLQASRTLLVQPASAAMATKANPVKQAGWSPTRPRQAGVSVQPDWQPSR